MCIGREMSVRFLLLNFADKMLSSCTPKAYASGSSDSGGKVAGPGARLDVTRTTCRATPSSEIFPDQRDGPNRGDVRRMRQGW
jgi:hypothetical protein